MQNGVSHLPLPVTSDPAGALDDPALLQTGEHPGRRAARWNIEYVDNLDLQRLVQRRLQGEKAPRRYSTRKAYNKNKKIYCSLDN